MSAMPYCSRLVDGWLLHVFLVWVKFAKFYKLCSLCITFILIIEEPNLQRLYGKSKVLTPNLDVAVDSDLWPGLLLLHSAPA